MRRWVMMLLLGIAATFVPVVPTFALSCLPRTSAEHFKSAEVVIVGTVIQAPVGMGNGPRPHVVQVERVFKGETGPTVTIMHNEMMGPDIHLQQGQRFLLLLNWSPELGGWQTSLCSGSQGLPGPTPAEWGGVLGEGYEPGDTPEQPVAEPKSGWSLPVWLFPVALVGVIAAGGLLLVQVRRKG